MSGRVSESARNLPTVTANVLPIRVSVTREESWASLCAAVSAEIAEAMRFQDYRGEEIPRDLVPHPGGPYFGPVLNKLPLSDSYRFGGQRAVLHKVSQSPVDDLSLFFCRLPEGDPARPAPPGGRVGRVRRDRARRIRGAALEDRRPAIQFVKNGGGIPVGVVGSERKAEILRRLGCEIVVTREEIGLGDDHSDNPDEVIRIGKRLGGIIREKTGRDPDIVFEHVGQATFGISVFVVGRGGTVVTCGSSTGYHHAFDNRYLWMKLKRIVGSHVANLQENVECGRLFESGRIVPTMSAVYPLADVGEAARLVQENRHTGKVAVLCLAPSEGLGVTDPARRASIGEDALNPLRGLSLVE